MSHIQLQQLINLSFLLFVAYFNEYLHLNLKEIFGILFFTFIFEHFLYYIQHKKIDFISFSSLSTSIGVILMMLATDYFIYFIVIISALLQKHFIHYKKQHFFNPSNFALLFGLLFYYNHAHLVLGQLGHSLWVILAVIIIGIFILYRANRLFIVVAFIFFYLLFQYLFVVAVDPVVIMEDIYKRFYSVSFIVFIFFMLTDPRTTPSKYIYQITFSMSIALFSTLLDYFYGFRVQHLFLTLFFVTPWIVLLQNYKDAKDKKSLLIKSSIVIILALSAIIYIQMQDPYYFEMDK